MPSTYASDRTKACILVILWPRPTMMPDRIGIIGNTQGVRASNRPAPKKNETISQKLPPLKSLAIWELSLSGKPAEAGTAGSGLMAEGGGASVIAGARGASWPVLASGRSSRTDFLMGG